MEITLTDEDLRFEEEVQRAPYSVSAWQRYLAHKRKHSVSDVRPVYIVYERALQRVPGSYKLWKQYLDLRVGRVHRLNPAVHADEHTKLTLCFERALLHQRRMPRLWLDYCGHAARQADVSAARRVFDRALRALPVTQHPRVWERYEAFAVRVGGVTCRRVYARLLRVWPERGAAYAAACEARGEWAEAARALVDEIDGGRSDERDAWRRLAHVLRRQPDALGARTERVVRDGIRRQGESAGALWTALAMYHGAGGRAERARDVFEEALRAAHGMRDFAQVFDAYAAWSEAQVAAAMGHLVDAPHGPAQLAVDLGMHRLERLLDRRAELASSVEVRQAPGSADAWLRRAAVFAARGDAEGVRAAYEQAVASVPAADADAKRVWLAYAESCATPAAARLVLERAGHALPATADAAGDVFAWWAEHELDAWDRSDELARRVLAQALQRVPRDRRLWALLVDLEESLDNVPATRAAYERMLELRVASAQTVVDYAGFLEDHGAFEDAFRVYERGIALLGHPVAVELWGVYLRRFLARYGGAQVERTRGLFEQAVAGCPPAYARPLYVAYAQFEETHGSTKRALSACARLARLAGVPLASERLESWRFYAAKTAELVGLPATRAVYQEAVERLPDAQALLMAVDFAQAERRMGEIDRARALFVYAAGLASDDAAEVWPAWHAFEVRHGSEDSFREMLREKRVVRARYAADAGVLAKAELRAKQRAAEKSVAAAARAEEAQAENAVAPANPDEVAIDDDF
ncbi:pre-mRNA-splicing factor syf1 [Coemansia interrupta]|uniref:Pre-mRNA-splicing factor syf1 n=1 Tax=Coemansia interrupta TaxID=1126814 RepID=A0A9W8LCV0_9FUNG|nr:pre-mRNA-splicing factor syf1 [Coemansia interrupta]